MAGDTHSVAQLSQTFDAPQLLWLPGQQFAADQGPARSAARGARAEHRAVWSSELRLQAAIWPVDPLRISRFVFATREGASLSFLAAKPH